MDETKARFQLGDNEWIEVELLEQDGKKHLRLSTGLFRRFVIRPIQACEIIISVEE